MLVKFYLWFWFHTEFWLTPVNRRPYTFIFRDWMYKNPYFAYILTLAWMFTLFFLNIAHPAIGYASIAFSFMLLAHLVWGTVWIEGEQEVPEYLGGE
jgi:hypothetical protein